MYGEIQIRTTWKDFDFYSFEENSIHEIIKAILDAHEEWIIEDSDGITYQGGTQ